jgi:hypothetical protein
MLTSELNETLTEAAVGLKVGLKEGFFDAPPSPPPGLGLGSMYGTKVDLANIHKCFIE